MKKKVKRQSERAKIENFDFDYTDLIVSSNQFKREFLIRCQELGFSPAILCMKLSIPYADFRKHYLEAPHPRCTKLFDQEQLIRLFKEVGLEPRVVLIRHNIENYRKKTKPSSR
jgi:hypothetical protein